MTSTRIIRVGRRAAGFVALALVACGGTGDDTGAGMSAGGTSAGSPNSLDPILLDDFEDLDPYPADSRFAGWQHYSYNPQGGDVYSHLDVPGFASNGGMRLTWNLLDTPNGGLEYPGCGLRTLAANVYVDLSAHSRVVLSHRHQNLGACTSISAFTFIVGCSELATSFEMDVPVSDTWETSVLTFDAFCEQTWQGATGIPIAECLALADDLHVQAQPPLLDGECGSGELFLDSISIR